MVAAASLAITQANDSEKRRKQTAERAKANHLSRQLQMRLQYARLKVDHGWQKQNLNEVENLYFHHSHQRGPRPYVVPSLIATTQHHSASFPAPTSSPSQSSLSFKLGPTNLSRNHKSTCLAVERPAYGGESRASDTNMGSASITLRPEVKVCNTELNGLSPDPAEPHCLTFMEVDQEDRHSLAPTIHSGALSLPMNINLHPNQPAHLSSQSGNGSNVKSPRTSPTPPTWGTVPVMSSSSASNHYPNVTQRALSHSQSAPSPTSDPYGFGSSTLTYDSFWSSHSAATGSRPFRASIGNILADVSGASFASGVDVSTSISDLSDANTCIGDRTQRADHGGKWRIGGSASGVGRATAGRER